VSFNLHRLQTTLQTLTADLNFINNLLSSTLLQKYLKSYKNGFLRRTRLCHLHGSPCHYHQCCPSHYGGKRLATANQLSLRLHPLQGDLTWQRRKVLEQCPWRRSPRRPSRPCLIQRHSQEHRLQQGRLLRRPHRHYASGLQLQWYLSHPCPVSRGDC
jgi:hypothetical protein